MQAAASAIVVMFSVLFPAKAWYAPSQPWMINVKSKDDVTLVLTDFAGKVIESKSSPDVHGPEKAIDIKQIFPDITGQPGTYILYAVPKGSTSPMEFVGTPLVIKARGDKRRGGAPGVIVVRIEPLRYVVLDTEKGKITAAFYYDVAANTADNFLSLAGDGFYDGLTFHRIVPGFVLQAGDPKGDSSGGPGYTVPAEFNDHPHLEGVLSMARSSEPDSAGSQFFVCLDYQNTKQLDGQYTAFGKVTEGMDVVKAIGQTPIADERAGKPVKAPVINKIEVKPVTPGNNPYAGLNPREATVK